MAFIIINKKGFGLMTYQGEEHFTLTDFADKYAERDEAVKVVGNRELWVIEK